MALNPRPSRKQMEDRVRAMRLPVRHAAKCYDCGTRVSLYTDTKPDEVVPRLITVATCPKCSAKWLITKL